MASRCCETCAHRDQAQCVHPLDEHAITPDQFCGWWRPEGLRIIFTRYEAPVHAIEMLWESDPERAPVLGPALRSSTPAPERPFTREQQHAFNRLPAWQREIITRDWA